MENYSQEELSPPKAKDGTLEITVMHSMDGSAAFHFEADNQHLRMPLERTSAPKMVPYPTFVLDSEQRAVLVDWLINDLQPK